MQSSILLVLAATVHCSLAEVRVEITEPKPENAKVSTSHACECPVDTDDCGAAALNR